MFLSDLLSLTYNFLITRREKDRDLYLDILENRGSLFINPSVSSSAGLQYMDLITKV